MVKDTCIRGHAMTPENTYNGAKGRRYCKECSRNKSKERRKDPLVRERRRERERGKGCRHGVYPAFNCIDCRYARSVKASLERGAPPKSYDEFVAKAGSLDALALSPMQAKAMDDFNFAVDTLGRPLCEKPVKRKVGERVVDYYPHADFDPERPPTVTEAAKMCMGCPVFDACDALGKALNTGKSKSDGVFAGQVYVNGKRVIDKK